MPELPEVEVVRRGIDTWVSGRTIETTQVLHSRAVRNHIGGSKDFARRLKGRTITSVNRRGKFMWLSLDDDHALVMPVECEGDRNRVLVAIAGIEESVEVGIDVTAFRKAATA